MITKSLKKKLLILQEYIAKLIELLPADCRQTSTSDMCEIWLYDNKIFISPTILENGPGWKVWHISNIGDTIEIGWAYSEKQIAIQAIQFIFKIELSKAANEIFMEQV